MFPIKDNYERQALFNYMLKFRIFDSLICDPFGNIFIQVREKYYLQYFLFMNFKNF